MLRPFLVLAAFVFVAAAAPWQNAAAEQPVLLRASKSILARPHDLLLSPDKRLLYVADQNNHAITVLDAETLALKGRFAEGKLSRPHDMVWDAQGRMLIADTGNDRIAIYAVDGVQARAVGELKGGLSSTEGLEIGRDGRIYATSVGDGTLVVYEKGKLARTIGGQGSGRDQFASPHDVAFAPDGNLWVADSSNDRVKIFDPSLKLVRILGKAEYGFSGVRYIAFDDAGRSYLADKYADRVVILDRSLKIAHVIGKLKNPEGVVTHGKRFWVSETYGDRVLLYEWK